MKSQRATLSAPKAALVHALTQCLTPAFATDDLTSADIREALDLAWDRVWDDFRNRRFEDVVENVRIRFVRKPADLIEALESLRMGELATRIAIQARVELSDDQYDEFAKTPLADRDWLTGKGGWDDENLRRVVMITAPDRFTLYADPSGGTYARYLGLAVDENDEVAL